MQVYLVVCPVISRDYIEIEHFQSPVIQAIFKYFASNFKIHMHRSLSLCYPKPSKGYLGSNTFLILESCSFDLDSGLQIYHAVLMVARCFFIIHVFFVSYIYFIFYENYTLLSTSLYSAAFIRISNHPNFASIL
jgi:hypothetical protein